MSQKPGARGERKATSRKPQTVNADIWYYESRGHIHVYVHKEELERQGYTMRNTFDARGVIEFKIPKRKLSASLRRMEAK